MSMGAFCCHGNQSFDPICPKTLCNLSPTLMMLHIKFDQHWPTGLRDIQVSSEWWQNSGRTRQIQYSPPFSKRGYNEHLDLMSHLQDHGHVPFKKCKVSSKSYIIHSYLVHFWQIWPPWYPYPIAHTPGILHSLGTWPWNDSDIQMPP